MKDTGERMIEEYHKGRPMWSAHYSRYFLASQFVKNKIVLDGSCGSGYGSYLLARNGKAKFVYGIDISKEAVTYAEKHFKRGNIKFLEENLENTSLLTDSIDVYVSFETIEHIKNYKNFLLDIKRVLKRNGLLVLSTPNSKAYLKGNPFHHKEFNADELAKLLGSHFKNTEILYQDNWVSSSIFNKKRLSIAGLQSLETLLINKIRSKNPEESRYFVVCASDRMLGEIKEFSVLFPFPPALYDCYVNQEILSAKKAEVDRLKDLINEKHTELRSIYNSRSWKLVSQLRRIKRTITSGSKHKKDDIERR